MSRLSKEVENILSTVTDAHLKKIILISVQIIDQGDKAKVTLLLKKYGVDKVRELPAKKYTDFERELIKLLN
jgi:hypothetical protein